MDALIVILLVIVGAITFIYGGANFIAWYDQGRPRGEPWNWRVFLGYHVYHRWWKR